ncbi:MAG TPA: hypothetical protein VGG39_37660 [Polyangiaceae bacterium]
MEQDTYSIWIGDLAELRGHVPRQATARSPHAPLFAGDAHPRQNFHQPKRSDWDEFCRVVGLHDIFFAPGDGLLAERPGNVRLTRDHARAVHEALVRFVDAERDTHPCFASGRPGDCHLARLMWLDWWIHWALKRFDEPGLHVR